MGSGAAGELAFETLMVRHGPMVMGVCRNVLNDPQDVHDAYQAVFFVLARQAKAIRNRESVGNWLYGVAVRVSARAKVAAVRRQIRDRRTIGAARSMAADVSVRHEASPAERHDQAEVVHQELSRLPNKYREPIVLCYLEGLTHDEAAAAIELAGRHGPQPAGAGQRSASYSPKSSRCDRTDCPGTDRELAHQ